VSDTPARARVFLTSTMHASFIEDDVASLRRHFDVDCYIGSGAGAPIEIIRRARRADVAISWFASVYTLFMVAATRMRGTPSIVILGGVDTARDDRIGYGIWRSRWRRPLLRWTLRHATRLLAVDPSLAHSLSRSSGLAHLNVDVLPTGYDSSFWTPGGARDPVVLAVAGCATHERALVKGIDLFVEAARRTPSVSFVLIGTARELVERFDPSPNLSILPRVDRTALLDHYRRASVFCLPSRHEGLPNALCEAMLCGCVPVGANVGGVADAIGCGELVPADDIDALVAAISRALSASDEVRSCARQRIIDRYPSDAREARLVAIVERLRNA
jgi:glycosyltransferase involved in cell wall biosynthesis